MRWLILLLALAQTATASEGEIYKWILPDGSIQYSDRPPADGAQKVELKPLQTYSLPATRAAPPAQTAPDQPGDKGSPYESFAIASPADEQAIRDNTGDLTVTFAVRPKLVGGHVIGLFMDGRMVGRSAGAPVAVSNVNRGSHRLHAVILDGDGTEIVRTETITVHLKRASARF